MKDRLEIQIGWTGAKHQQWLNARQAASHYQVMARPY